MYLIDFRAIHRKLFVIPKLGKCWGFFPLLGNGWDSIFLSWETIGKSLGLFFPTLGSLWEMKQNIFLNTNVGNPMGFLPTIWENDWTIFSQVGKYFNMLFPI